MLKKKQVPMWLAGLAVAICVVACAKIPSVRQTERDLRLSLQHEGYQREFILHLPAKPASLQTAPLLIIIHGGGGTAAGMIKLTQGRFNILADQHGFLAVYPQGIQKSWNDEREDPVSVAHKKKIDDIGFFKKLIEKMVREYQADPKRVFVTGISNGGFMSFRISRELADQVKAVAPVTAALPLSARHAHLQAPPMPVLIMNGTADPLVPFNGGDVKVLGQRRGRILSTEETINVFLTRNHCSGEPAKTELPDIDPADHTRVIKYEYPSGPGGKVVLIKIQGGGHTWPGGWQYLSERHIGKTSRDINACDEIWNFFSSLESSPNH